MMGILDRLFGREERPAQRRPSEGRRSARPGVSGARSAGNLTDEQAVERYRYLLETAPPETIEQPHAEAFEKLTPDQRRMVLQELTTTLPEHERSAGAQVRDDPRSLARMATRAEMRQPGTLERTFGGMRGPGIGGMMAGGFFGSFAGMMVGGMIAQQFFENDAGHDQGSAEGQASAEADGGDAASGDMAQADADQMDAGGFEETGFDPGGDFGGDLGGDF